MPVAGMAMIASLATAAISTGHRWRATNCSQRSPCHGLPLPARWMRIRLPRTSTGESEDRRQRRQCDQDRDRDGGGGRDAHLGEERDADDGEPGQRDDHRQSGEHDSRTGGTRRAIRGLLGISPEG
jgi:hypothetical protein